MMIGVEWNTMWPKITGRLTFNCFHFGFLKLDIKFSYYSYLSQPSCGVSAFLLPTHYVVANNFKKDQRRSQTFVLDIGQSLQTYFSNSPPPAPLFFSCQSDSWFKSVYFVRNWFLATGSCETVKCSNTSIIRLSFAAKEMVSSIIWMLHSPLLYHCVR